MALPSKKIKNIKLPGDVDGSKTYEIVPEMLGKGGYSAELPTLTENSTIALTTDIPTSLPANGGNADTVDNKHASDFATSTHNHDSSYVAKNDAITAATKCKITYDAKGLVTAGADLTATDIPSLGAGKITSGTFDIARIPTGNTGTTVCLGNDSRLSDSRTPKSHTHGNITNAGKLATASVIVVTNTDKEIEAGTINPANIIQEGDSRLTNSRPASDVYSWAKASSKPSYTLDEVSDGTTRKLSNYSLTTHNHDTVYQPKGSYAPGSHAHSVTAAGSVSLSSGTSSGTGKVAYINAVSFVDGVLTLETKYMSGSFTGTAVDSGDVK